MASAAEFAVEVLDDRQGRTVVLVSGELDLATSSELEAVLDATDPASKVLIDLTSCEFLDSSALRVLLTSAARADAAGGSLGLVAPNPRIRRALEIASVDSRMQIHESRDPAA